MSKEKTTPTLDEYITLLIKAKRLKALDKSRNRTSIRIPIIPNQESEEHWKRRLMLDIDQAETYLSRAMAEGNNEDAGYWKDMLEELLKQEEQGLPVMVQGANCMYIAGDCYGLNIPGNQTFAAKHKEKGFKRVDSSNMEPGDIVQDVGDGVPTHAMIFDSKDKNGKPLYNYARGFYSGIFKEDYVKQGHYPMIEDPLVYRYVGTPADSTQWINLYKLIYGLGKGGIIGVPYLKKGGEINKIKLIPKGQSGWTAYLNPKNWGLRTYEGDIENAYDAARANKDKKFLWKGIRISTKQVPIELPSLESRDFTNRILKNSKVLGTSQSELTADSDKFSYLYLTTTPLQDSIWNVYDGVNEVNVFKNGVTNKYDYSVHKNGEIVSEKESLDSIPQRLHDYIYSKKYSR